MSHGEYPSDDLLDPLWTEIPRASWTEAYADHLMDQIEAQEHAELVIQYEKVIADPPINKATVAAWALGTQVLSCQMVPNNVDAKTVGEFLKALLSTLWEEAEGFSGKRPFGDSDWQWQVYKSLVKEGFVEGIILEDEELEDFTREAQKTADELILSAIRSLN